MRSTSKTLFMGLAVAAVLTTAAQAQDDAGAMALGVEVAPPLGFLALCETAPEECIADRPNRAQLSEVRAWAGRARWARTFADAGISLGAEPASQALVPNTLSDAENAHVGDAILKARVQAKADARKAASRRPAKTKPGYPPALVKSKPSAAPEIIEVPAALAPVSFALLETVNRRINRAIRRSTDEATFGQADVWAVPSGSRARGDCEDYALAKRRALIEEGVDPNLISVGIVRTYRGEIHAVLLVETGRGEYVLDNLSPWVVRWNQAPYHWLERQVPGAPLTWVRVDAQAART